MENGHRQLSSVSVCIPVGASVRNSQRVGPANATVAVLIVETVAAIMSPNVS